MSVKDKIRNEIANLAGRKYDHDGCGSLPIRPDVAHFAAHDLFPPFLAGISQKALDFAGEPSILLSKDGTLELSFAVGGRELLITIQCGGVISYIKVYEDGQTSIEGVLRGPWQVASSPESGFPHLPALNDLLFWVATGITPK